MPIYSYECVECDYRQEAERDYDHRHEFETCKKCGAPCEYVMSPTAGFMKGGPTVPSNRRRIRK